MGRRLADTVAPLCYRCEHRARAYEKGMAPRFECGNLDHAVVGCYMYEPVRPVVLRRDAGEKRGMSWPAVVRARSHGVRVAEGENVMTQVGDEYVVEFVVNKGK